MRRTGIDTVSSATSSNTLPVSASSTTVQEETITRSSSPPKRHSSFKDHSKRDITVSEQEDLINNNDIGVYQQVKDKGSLYANGALPNRTDCTGDSDNLVAGRQQRDTNTRLKDNEGRRIELVHSISTSSILSKTPSSPPSLSASTPSTTVSSALSLALLESPTSPCPSESNHSLLSNSTLSSPAQIYFDINKGKKMTSSTTTGTEITKRSSSSSSSHMRNISNGSGVSTGTGGGDNSVLLASSTGSNTSTSRRSGRRKSATPSAINIHAANVASSSSSSTAPLSSSSAGTAKERISSALSGLISPTSAEKLTSAQQTSLERALAAGISRDEFEKTRASVVSMLRGQAAASASASTSAAAPPSSSSSSSTANGGKERSITPQPLNFPNSTSSSTDTSLLFNNSEMMHEGDSGTTKQHSALPRLAISTSSNKRELTSGRNSNRHSTSTLSNSNSSLTAISDINSTAPSTAASTLRTSVSSSNTDDVNNRESPTTSEDGDNAIDTGDMAVDEEKKQDTSIGGKSRGRPQTPIRNLDIPLSSQSQQEDENMQSTSSVERSKSMAGLEEEEEDSSFNAATAAAAALGMLASSPMKVVERRPPSTQHNNNNSNQIPFMNGVSGIFSQHRGGSSGALVSSSSPPLLHRGNTDSLGQGLVPSSSSRGGGGHHHFYSSPGSSSRSPSNLKNDSSGELSAEGLVAAVALGESSAATRDNRQSHKISSSTTPVRTRLEDIALKSSAQIRRQREELGLGEEEMMDLDTDARHENALLRGAFGDDDDDDEEIVGGEDNEDILQQQPVRRRRQSSRRAPANRKQDDYEDESTGLLLGGSGLAPPFSYPHPTASSSSASTSTGRKASRSPSRPISNGSRGEGRSSTTAQQHSRTASRGTLQFSPARLGSPQLPSSSQLQLASASTATAGSTSRRRAGHHHHKRVSSYGMSGMMDRFMESNYSPKASQIAKFEEAVRRASPERSNSSSSITNLPIPSSSGNSYDTDRTLMHHGQHQPQYLEEEDDEDDVYYEEVDDEDAKDEEDVTVHSTPRTHMDKTRLLRSAGNDLPSPLLQQIRMLSDADHSPHSSAERPHRERETPRYARGATGYSAHQELGLSSGHGSSSEFGSARKRKASYDLQSPRHLVRNMHTSPTPEEEDEDEEVQRGPRAAASPPPFPNFEQSNPKFYERVSAGHPGSVGLFDGPTPSHSQTSSQSSAASYRLSQTQPQSAHHRQPYAQSHQAHPHTQHQHSRHYVQEHQVPPPHFGISSHQQPPSSGERPPPVHYQQYPRHANGADELSHYALAPPRPPSHGHSAHVLHSSHMSRPDSVSSDYIPNQRELKKKEKAMKKAQGPLRRERHDSIPSSTASGPVAGPSSTSGAASASTLENFVPANVQIGQYDEKTKPPFSYAALIGQAIFSTPNRRMSLADIYTYIMTLYPFYRKQDAGWQNSIRHNLSLNECFVKTQRGPDEPGKGCLWSILPGTEEQFTGGNFYKKGKIPKSALKGGGGDEGGSSIAASSNDDGGKRKKANSVASGTETMSVMSADDSFETQSANSYSFASNNSSMMQSHGYSEGQRPVQHYAHHPAYAHQGYAASHHHPGTQPHGPSSLRQKQQLQYSDDVEHEDAYEEDDDSFDMDDPPTRYARPEQPQPPSSAQRHQQEQIQQHRPKLVVKQPKAADDGPGPSAKRESSPEGEAEGLARAASDYDQHDVFDAPPEAEQSFSNSDRSGSLEPVKRQQPVSHTSPLRRGVPHPHDRQRALLTSPPIMSSPPTNVFARMSQPYQPLRTCFNLPSSNMHAEALMSSPPPSSGIMPSDVRMRRLPPPTPRRSSADGEEHPGSHIFLPAPNIKPGKASFGKKTGDGDEDKPTLPPIHMMSPASALALNTQSPVSSVRGSAAQHRSSSPSPKSSSQTSSSANSITRSPTLNKSRHLHSTEVFKTPDRFAAPSSRTISSPHKLAHLANNNASKALQALQTPKIGSSRAGHGLVTPGGYYDPYEYGAVLDEELDRMMATNKEDGGRSDRRPLPFPSPVDRTPKWQPWSPW